MMLFVKRPNRAYRRARQSRRSRSRNGICLAAVRALTGAKLPLQYDITLLQAALSTGSNVHYVEAGEILIKSGDVSLIKSVVAGDIPILEAAKSVKAQVRAVEAIKAATSANLAAIYNETGLTNQLSQL